MKSILAFWSFVCFLNGNAYCKSAWKLTRDDIKNAIDVEEGQEIMSKTSIPIISYIRY